MNNRLNTLVRDIMTDVTVTVAPDDNLAHVASLLTEHDINAAPVFDNGVCVGMVSRSDIVRALSDRSLSGHLPRTSEDDLIRYRVIETLVAIPGASPWLTDVAVQGRVVALSGLIEDETMLLPTREAVALIDRVDEVIDRRHGPSAVLPPGELSTT